MHKIYKGLSKKLVAATLAATVATGCSALGGALVDKALGANDGIEATAQVGQDNQKGMVNSNIDSSKEVNVDIGKVAGDSNVGSGNTKTITNQGKDMLMMVLAGAAAPLLLLLYFIPSPRWLAKRHAEFCSKEHE